MRRWERGYRKEEDTKGACWLSLWYFVGYIPWAWKVETRHLHTVSASVFQPLKHRALCQGWR